MVVPDVRTVTYADDITVYHSNKDEGEVIDQLQKAACKILEYMQSNLLAANPEKTKFIMFGNKKDRAITVGSSLINESDSERLLGVEINRNLTWGCQMEKLKTDLCRRIGIIRRLSNHLSRKTACEIITPIFTSKLTYALEIFTDPSTIFGSPPFTDPNILKLQTLQNKAMRAALGLSGQRDKAKSSASLLRKTGQTSILELSLRAVSRHAGMSLGKLSKKGQYVLKDSVKNVSHQRNTRSALSGRLPPQDSSGTLVSSMARVWNNLPETIKNLEHIESFKKEVKSHWSEICQG